MKTFYKWVGLVVTVLLVGYGIFYFSQRTFLYHPNGYQPSRKDFKAQEMQKLHFKTKDGLMLAAWFKAPQINKPTIVYFHGNSGHFGTRYQNVKTYISQGYGAFLFSYRGFAGNAGNPSEQGLYLDGSAAIRWLLRHHFNSLVYYGESLGTGVAIEMARSYPPKAIILQSPYTSITDLARLHYAWSPLTPWDKYDSFSKISTLSKTPILILHGLKDDLIPPTHAQKLFDKKQGPKALKLYPFKHHGDMQDRQLTLDVMTFLARFSGDGCSSQ